MGRMANYPTPVTVRLDDGEREILKRMQAFQSRPGLVVSQSDALKVALHDWAAAHPEEAKDNPPFPLASTHSAAVP
jgi:hypothetical protein